MGYAGRLPAMSESISPDVGEPGIHLGANAQVWPGAKNIGRDDGGAVEAILSLLV